VDCRRAIANGCVRRSAFEALHRLANVRGDVSGEMCSVCRYYLFSRCPSASRMRNSRPAA